MKRRKGHGGRRIFKKGGRIFKEGREDFQGGAEDFQGGAGPEEFPCGRILQDLCFRGIFQAGSGLLAEGAGRKVDEKGNVKECKWRLAVWKFLRIFTL